MEKAPWMQENLNIIGRQTAWHLFQPIYKNYLLKIYLGSVENYINKKFFIETNSFTDWRLLVKA